jgi:hypothetical protein
VPVLQNRMQVIMQHMDFIQMIMVKVFISAAMFRFRGPMKPAR